MSKRRAPPQRTKPPSAKPPTGNGQAATAQPERTIFETPPRARPTLVNRVLLALAAIALAAWIALLTIMALAA